MLILLRQVRHLTRYFTLLGVLVFIYHWMAINETVALAFIGPAIYIAYVAKSAAGAYIEIQNSRAVDDFAFLLPATVFYYALVGFLIKQIWNERGWMKTVTLFAFLAFLIFIHYTAWTRLTAYFTANP